MMNKLMSLGSLILLLLWSTQPVKAQEEQSLLWEVSGNGLPHSSYLFGTIHVICPDDFFWTDHFEQAFNETKQLYLEMDMSDPELMQKMQQELMTPQKGWTEGLAEEDIKMLLGVVAKMSGIEPEMMSPDLLEEFSPFILTQLIILGGLDCALPASYDMDILEKAQNKNMPIKGLEDLEVQLKALRSMALEDMFASTQQEDFQLKTLIDVYKKQDIEALYELMHATEIKISDDLLKDRNHNWIPVIEEAAKELPTFFAFGAGHLAGDDGIIQLLREKGYTIKAIK